MIEISLDLRSVYTIIYTFDVVYREEKILIADTQVPT